MVCKRFIFGCIILSVWTCVARCQNDVPFEMGEWNMGRSSEQGFESVHRRSANVDDIDHFKPMPIDVNNVSAKDYKKNRKLARGLSQPRNPIESNINVNVNHHDRSHYQRIKKPSNQSDHRARRKQRESHENRLNRLLQMIHTMPNSNIDYNLAHPYGNVQVQKRNDSKRKILGQDDDSDESDSDEKKPDINCRAIVTEALKYLKSVEIRLSSLEKKLRSLISQPQDVASSEESEEKK